MSAPSQIKKKLNMLKRAPCKEIIYDAISIALRGDRKGQYIPDIVSSILCEIENGYLQQIPKKQPKVKHYDLEKMIADIKQKDAETLKRGKE